MFEKIRRPGKSNRKGLVKKFFAYLIFGLICLVFVFITPFGSQFGGLGEGVVAHVGNEIIRSREFSFVERNLREQYKDKLNVASSQEARKLEKEIQNQALSRILNLYLVGQGAKKEGFAISDGEVRDFIGSFPFFQEDGQFIYSRYQAFLKNQNLHVSAFEKRIRRDLVANQWSQLFFKAIKSNSLEKEKMNERNLYQVKLRFVEMDVRKVNIKLKEVLTTGNRGKILSYLKKSQVTWENVEAFPAVNPYVFQFRNNKKVLNRLLEHLPQTGLIPEAIQNRDKIYIVDVLSFTKKQQKSRDLSLFLNFEKPNSLFEAWLKEMEQENKVRLNEAFLGRIDPS